MGAMSAGARFRAAMQAEKPLQCVGAINAYHARLVERTGFRSVYLSGGGVAAGSLGLPDLGISNLEDILTDVRRITDVCTLPLLVDVDTGFGASAFNIARTVKSLVKAGAAAMHIEDQVGAKRCGHRPGKELVSREEMVDRIKAAVDAKTDADFVVMARTDALAVEGLERAIERALACVEAGADAIIVQDLGVARLARALEARGFVVTTAETVADGLDQVERRTPAFAVVDMRLGDGNGLDVISALKKRRPDARGVVLTGYGNIATAVTAVKLGAFDYLSKPADADDVVAALLASEGKKPDVPENPMSADRVRWEHIQRIYELCGRNVSETARRLNMHRRTLQRILAKRAPK